MTVLVHSYSHLWAGDGGAWSRRAAVGLIERLSRLLDVAFAIPGTQIRCGVEALLRAIPGSGDVAALALSCWVLYEAWRLGVPRPLRARMIANVLVEGIAGTEPVAGEPVRSRMAGQLSAPNPRSQSRSLCTYERNCFGLPQS